MTSDGGATWVEVAHCDDAGDCAGSGAVVGVDYCAEYNRARLSTGALRAGEYLVLLEGYGSYEGAYELSVSCATPCGDALAALGGACAGELACAQTVTGDTSGAVSVSGTSGSGDAWFALTLDGPVDELTFDTCASDFDTYLRLYSVARCDDTCASARNGVCEDGRSGGGGGYGYGYGYGDDDAYGGGSYGGGSYGGGHGAACALGTDRGNRAT